ncbi:MULTISPECIES: 50S ribosomal protein L25/general stress protein Ctc [Pseudomonas]|jgi:large subunit ribosomal protein L25|uniref:Large ribosomal subunit protein bL25 n=2 Tax=Ectopseudomonas TaxID=3236654 RepID=A0A653B844_ECTOL|nr:MULTISPECIES: 50S ribosomal protein L25/general stress protein Ctc [Pseudomonas]TNF18685.1 MAG: 50S ribosomal protein L25/general stress protein Ctc [Pseudomonadales bacterium]CAE6899644.1 50S ribosomal protein L25 [Pseudomonas oleovorans]QFT20985.1 50S ribosomal protein L25 [Pseudomonas sp. THAF187a]QFT41174.1 50S ribosomal protein L25 [Pseudomonas sp. THAF42]QTS87594.1 50S ribosomal protein L25/general stress protein Ctc [Pseudomonas khazarica]|tara:strand:- start:1647 stop:2258 length:612 start_codon:yes stop_codon:yes gene_type:complete
MTVEFALNAEVRSDLGKGASRRLRRNVSMVPAVIYGGEKAPASISLLAKDLAKLLENEAAFSHVLTLDVAGTKESVLIKALQRHPAKGFVLHADFVRVVAGQKLSAHVPLHFINEATAVGVKQQGGEISHTISEVEVSCLPKDLPEFIEVDMAAVEVGQTVHMSDLKLPKGVELVALAHGNDLAVSNIHASRVKAEDEESAAE